MASGTSVDRFCCACGDGAGASYGHRSLCVDQMRPMSLYESGESSGAVSLSELFSPDDKPIFAENKATLENIAFLICRGGWPQRLSWKGDDALVQAFDYLDAVVKSDISQWTAFPAMRPVHCS